MSHVILYFLRMFPDGWRNHSFRVVMTENFVSIVSIVLFFAEHLTWSFVRAILIINWCEVSKVRYMCKNATLKTTQAMPRYIVLEGLAHDFWVKGSFAFTPPKNLFEKCNKLSKPLCLVWLKIRKSIFMALKVWNQTIDNYLSVIKFPTIKCYFAEILNSEDPIFW